MLLQHSLDLFRINQLTANRDRVVQSIEDVVEPVIVAVDQIAGIKPALPQPRRCLLRSVPIAQHQFRPADDKFTNLTSRYLVVWRHLLLAARADHTHVHADERATDAVASSLTVALGWLEQ